MAPETAFNDLETSGLEVNGLEIVDATSEPRADNSPILGTLENASPTSSEHLPKGHMRRVSAAVRPKVEAEGWSLGNRWSNGLQWPIVLWVVGIHLAALAAPFYFSWSGLAVFVFLYWFTGPIGICLGFHRQLTHKSFSTYAPVRWALAFIGGLAGQGSAIQWVANHRKHHVFSDTEHDPHSPRHGGLWSHMLWFMPNLGSKYHAELAERYAPDLARDPVLRGLDKLFLPIQITLGLSLCGLGYLAGGPYLAASWVLWGMFVRMVWVFHITWFVNSASHMWGYRNYETSDGSRNLWWVGLLAAGEGWHNNHHAHQRMAKHGHRWWEFDLTYTTICVMEKLGLAWDVVRDIPTRQEAAAS